MSTRSDMQALALAACLALPGAVFAQSLPHDLDAYIEDVRSEWKVTGLVRSTAGASTCCMT